VDFEIASRVDVYEGAPQSSSARKFGSVGITFRARKVSDDGEWMRALEALQCEVR
jgi:hypothetical protein